MSQPVEGPWADVSKRHFVHEETVKHEEWTRQQGFIAYHKNTVEKAREQSLKETFVGQDYMQYKGTINEIVVPVPHLKEGIATSVYKPEKAGSGPWTIIVYFHGGGLVVCDRCCFHGQSMQLSTRTEAIIVIPEYRLLPIPGDEMAPFDDCVAVTEWVLKNKEAVGGQADSKVGVAGDSAGGQITSSVTHSIKGGLAFQVLVYPVAGMHCEVNSFQEFLSTPGFNGLDMTKMFKDANHYTDDIRKNPRANPAARTADDLATCPPTMVLITPLDPLADWGREFADKLKAAGVKTELVVVEGAPHSFFTLVKRYPIKSREAHEHVARFVKSFA